MQASQIAVDTLKGVGPKTAQRLRQLGIESLQDLLFHLPIRYQDRTRIVPIADLKSAQTVLISGYLEQSSVRWGRQRSLVCRLSDGTASVLLRFFHFNRNQQRSLQVDARLSCFGQVRQGAQGLELIHPDYRILDSDQAVPVQDCLTPIYPITDGLGQATLRSLMEQALDALRRGEVQLPDFLPSSLRRELDWFTLEDAIAVAHQPGPELALDGLERVSNPALKRLAFEELLAHHLSLRLIRSRLKRCAAPRVGKPGHESEALIDQLPFELTGAQQRVIQEIRSDLERGSPMQRLVQGDVGCGKTIIAAMAAVQVVESGYQVAVMAPTELLAEQHRKQFLQWLQPLGIQVSFLIGGMKSADRTRNLESIGNGQTQIIVGTHALFQESVRFASLGLLIVDEQHRFGVHQRYSLRSKSEGAGWVPHQLVMTATPIPRTLAMTAYADLETSVIDQLPPGRKPIQTVVVPDARRDQVINRIQLQLQQGRQVYWTCALVEQSESLQCRAAEQTLEDLRQVLPGVPIGLVHGRIKAEEKHAIMDRFKSGELRLLVATTVIEVGVDVPNASLMVIDNAERFGLAQLHQLRGRIGRGCQNSTCVLLYHGALSQVARRRLAVMRESQDGFVIAQRDLELRGPGEMFGVRQSGSLQFRIADLVRDQSLITLVGSCAQRMMQSHREQLEPLIHRWLHEGHEYGEV